MTPRPSWRALRARRRCRALAAGLELPVPFDAAALAAAVARRRGRPVELMPTAWRPGLPCGLLISAEQADYIVYVADTPPLHRAHILVHELAHLLCGHRGTASGELLPHLPAGLAGRVLGRTVYSAPQEREAELLASLILQRAVWTDSPAARPDPFLGPAPRTGRP
ncbi:ParH-like protein [Streptomyces caatingaensis]|uniref:ParH-like protein n=1 Tax=Streptomyces caatingaensis TaxID=1678637 RepID=A0A0K9XGC8_9ACTN|nr:ParH-like protein [Streptomyces caatingaensis]KNB52288.1 ParH-like protein [Streptomyces caatingaensis]